MKIRGNFFTRCALTFEFCPPGCGAITGFGGGTDAVERKDVVEVDVVATDCAFSSVGSSICESNISNSPSSSSSKKLSSTLDDTGLDDVEVAVELLDVGTGKLFGSVPFALVDVAGKLLVVGIRGEAILFTSGTLNV